MAAIAAYSQK